MRAVVAPCALVALCVLALAPDTIAATAAPNEIAAAPVASCAPRSVHPRVDTNGASGQIFVYVDLHNTTGHACLTHGRLFLSLRDAKTHRLLHIVGNPHGQRVDRRLRAGRNRIFTVVWSNYCGPGRPMDFEVRFGAEHTAQRSGYPGARCDSKSQPSRLKLFHLPG
jgi:hypothetical protein